MAYEKQTFVDEITDENGNIVQEGTLIKAKHFQHIEDGIVDIVEPTPNLFNKDDPDLIHGYHGYHIYYGENYRMSHPIFVTEGIEYRFSVAYDVFGSIADNVIYLDDNKEFIYDEYGGIPYQEATFSADLTTASFVATKTGYVRINIGHVSDLDTAMFCEADKYSSTYIPYATQIKPLVPYNLLYGDIPNEMVQALANALRASPLAGKSVTYNGDSICAGAENQGGYGKIIADMYGMTYENKGVGGGVIVTGQTYDNGKDRHSICSTIATMNAEADYAIVEGGVNDASLQVTLGEMSNGYTATLDTTTFYGAFEYMCKELVTRFAGKKIGYIAVHKMTAEYSSEDTQYKYYQAAKECCEKWGVPFCDLNTSVPPFKYITELKERYTVNGDGWHPNEEGYRKYYVPKIIAFMESL